MVGLQERLIPTPQLTRIVVQRDTVWFAGPLQQGPAATRSPARSSAAPDRGYYGNNLHSETPATVVNVLGNAQP
jgi:hypothetical protein